MPKSRRRWFLCSFLMAILLVAGMGCPPGQEGLKSDMTGSEASGNPQLPEKKKEIKPMEVIQWSGVKDQSWKEYDTLVNEQKYEQATKLVEDLLEKAKSTRNSEEWVRGLIRYVQLRTALHGYETAVKFLKEQAWPDDLLGHSVLNLFYAQSLITYAQAYSWEIRNREKIDSKGVVDLKAWTLEQIYEEAQKAAEEVWQQRKLLGEFPVAALNEYVTPNNYPPEIRNSLRDAVSYLRVELLADTTGWRPEQSNDLFQLDLGLLLGENPQKSKQKFEQLSLDDPRVHPMLKICAVLDDLESWHQEKGENEAALEARRVRLLQLHNSFTSSLDRESIKKQLETRLVKDRNLKWWAMGMAQLAQFVQAEDAADSQIRARKIVQECIQAYPDTVGGQACRSILGGIEQPDFQLEGMAADAPQKRSLGINYKNMKKLYFRAYPFDLLNFLSKADDYSLMPDYRQIDLLLANAKPSHQWSVDLPETVDFKNHKFFVTPPMEKTGAYVVVASARKDFSKSENKLLGINQIIGDLVLVSRQEGNVVDVDVQSGSTGRPVALAKVHLFQYNWNTKHKIVDSKITGREGSVRFSRQDNNYSYFLVAEKGKELAIDPNYMYLYNSGSPSVAYSTLIYTDRSIYRPQQKILFKAIVYQGRYDLGNFKVAPSTPVTISLMDSNYQVVEQKSLTTNSFGSASGDFVIPTGRLMGQWQLQSSHNGQGYIRVEEYKRPTFETKLLDPKSPLRLNLPATLTGEARYYFGLPVVSGMVKWQVTRSPVYPWWWSYYWWWDTNPSGSSRPQTVDAGSAELKDDGSFSLEFTPKADERLAKESKDLSYNYTVTVDVTDEGGETRSATRSFRLGFVAVEARVDMEKEFFLDGQPSELTVVRTNLDGVPQEGLGSYRILSLKSPPEALLPVDQPYPTPPEKQKAPGFRTLDDERRERWDPRYDPNGVMLAWADGPEKASGSLTHNQKGEAKVTLPALAAGAYRLRYATKDAFGAPYQMSKEFVVAGKKPNLALPGLLLVEKNTVKVGQTARIFAVSGLSDQPMVLDFYRDGKRTERRMLESGKGNSLIEIPVTEAHRGGFGLTLTVVRDHQFMSFQQYVFVPWDNKELKVTFSTFRDLLRPAAREKWSVKVTGPSGQETPVQAAEVLAYMYDRSLDAFAPHNPPSPLGIFPNHSGIAWARSSLFPAQQQWLECSGFALIPPYPDLYGDIPNFFSGYAIGGPGGRHMAHRGLLKAGLDRDRRESKEESAKSPMLMPMSTTVADKESDKKMERADLSGKDDKPAEAAAEAGGEAAPKVELRTDFSETAFFQPHLITDANGSVSFEFTVPDSVTSWNVWAHAITQDLVSGSIKQEAKTVKDLMVRPYLPRFLREGDQAELKVVVNNASDKELKGQLTFDIVDPESGQSVLQSFGLEKNRAQNRPFTVAAGKGTNLSFAIKTPAKVGLVAVKVTAVSGDFSDGELRPIPVLPGRMHLIQSRFVTLKDQVRKELKFADLAKDDDPTRIQEQMVVTIDAQLFYSVLSALPYLVNYPYECTEQTLNRFVSTGILSSLYKNYPAIEAMAKKFAERKTQFETWDQPDPNRKMALEETPWVQMAKGGEEDPKDLINVLDPQITKAQREQSLAKLRKAQTSSGGFPWFPGGPPSPYMTLYILYGFSKALEFGVEVPQDMVQRAWGYLHRHYVDEILRDMMAHDCCWEFVTFLNYTLSNFPNTSWTGGVFTDEERKQMLDFSFKHWKRHSPYLKGYLALTLNRMDRKKEAVLVWESVMDSAKTAEDQGTFWAPEDRGWLWYNDTIETHAFAIRTVMELTPKEQKLDGLVLWLFLNKKLNHWKSTRATAEVIYSLAHYLKKTEQLGLEEQIQVTAGDIVKKFVFRPDEYTGKKNQIVIPGEQVDPKKTSTIVVEKSTKGYAFASATWHFSTERLPQKGSGDYLNVTRKFFKRVKTGRETVLEPLEEGARIEVGDEVEVHLSLSSKHPMEYVHLRDPRAAGFEPASSVSQHKWALGIYWYEEIRDSGTNFFFENLPQGEYPFQYRIRAAVAGTFKVAPATVQPMYAPEFSAYSAGEVVTIRPVKAE